MPGAGHNTLYIFYTKVGVSGGCDLVLFRSRETLSPFTEPYLGEKTLPELLYSDLSGKIRKL